MNFLLDTQIVLWAVSEPDRISRSAFKLLNDPAHRFVISVVSIWETNLKYSTGKLKLANPPEIFWPQSITRLKTSLLTVTLAHALAIHTLPFHHRDPFDRMLIAQALTENLTVITADTCFKKYPVPIST